VSEPAPPKAPASGPAARDEAAAQVEHRLVLREGAALRFWTVTLQGREVRLRWGLHGTVGSRLVKELPTPGKARAELERLLRQRQAMGYEEAPAPAGDAGGAE
jgi:predicted DNA-binding WGR domain protein